MASIDWIKFMIAVKWAEGRPDRFDPEPAKAEIDEHGWIRDYENSYAMHHKIVEASAGEVKDLMARQAKADAGFIRWDEERQELYEIDEQLHPPLIAGRRPRVEVPMATGHLPGVWLPVRVAFQPPVVFF